MNPLQTLKHFGTVLLFIVISILVNAQVNIAPLATTNAQGSGSYSWANVQNWSGINDGTYYKCGYQDAYIWTTSPPNGTEWMEWKWDNPYELRSLVIYYYAITHRFLGGGTIQVWNGSGWEDYHTFSGLDQSQCVHSINLTPVTTTGMRIAKWVMGNGQKSNPSFREIEIFATEGKTCNLALVANNTNVTCPGGSDGSIDLTVSNGTEPYSYNWSNGATSQDLTSISAGTYTVTITDADNCSEIASNVISESPDNIPPIAVAHNITVSLDASGKVTISANDINIGSYDNCGGIRTMDVTPSYFSCDQIGDNTVTLTVTDMSSNSSSTTAVVTVIDNYDPILSNCPSNIFQSNEAGSCGTKVSWTAPTASDNCGATLSSSHNSGDYFPVGTTTVTYTAEDAAGNKATCSFDVTVTDDELPNVVTQSTSVTLSGGSVSISVSDINNGSSDNCGIDVIAVEPSSFDCDDLGIQTVTLTVKDIHGNVNTGTATVTVNGAAPSCSISSAPNSSGDVIGSMTTYAATNQMFLGYGAQSMNITCSASGGSSFNYSWSGSGLSSSSVANPVFTPSAPGNYTLTCTITNEYGCAATCSIVICVMDARGSGGSANNPKVTICHIPQGNSGNPQTLSISANAVAAHLGNHGGCTLGACDASCDDNSSYKYDAQADFYYMGYGEDDLDLMVYPNPSTSDFAFVLESPFSTEVELSIHDLSGRLLETMNDLSAHTEQRFGADLPVGVYMVSIQQEGYTKTFKVVKLD